LSETRWMSPLLPATSPLGSAPATLGESVSATAIEKTLLLVARVFTFLLRQERDLHRLGRAGGDVDRVIDRLEVRVAKADAVLSGRERDRVRKRRQIVKVAVDEPARPGLDDHPQEAFVAGERSLARRARTDLHGRAEPRAAGLTLGRRGRFLVTR